jgi:NitT/TauT family transport system ATP-binding protein
MELRASAVEHRYGALAALGSLDLTVRDGEVLALIGPSGCGKSTLLGILGGLLQPSAGSVELIGAPPADCLNPCTYVFQDFALLPWRDVRANVALALEHHSLSSSERAARIADVLALTGLAEFAHAFPKQLSGGMKQRVGLARALAVRPAILLMDEPLSALDAQTRTLLTEEFRSLRRQRPSTVVWVTHNLDEALTVADRVTVLSRRPGRIVDEFAVDPAKRAEQHTRLWSAIERDVRAADREVVGA